MKSMLLWIARKIYKRWPWRPRTSEEMWEAMAAVEHKYVPRALVLSRTTIEGWDRIYRQIEDRRVAGGYAALEHLSKSGRWNRRQLAALRLLLQLVMK